MMIERQTVFAPDGNPFAHSMYLSGGGGTPPGDGDSSPQDESPPNDDDAPGDGVPEQSGAPSTGTPPGGTKVPPNG